MLYAAALLTVLAAAERHSELWTREQEDAAGIVRERIISPRPSIATEDLPDAFSWADKDGKSYITKTLNQHIPQYCGSCWAHGALSALADRIKIARKGQGIDINLAVQHLLNCGGGGSCHGGSPSAAYGWLAKNPIAFDTCQPYMACSKESTEGFCNASGTDWTCTAANTCRTCGTFGACGTCTCFPTGTSTALSMYWTSGASLVLEILWACTVGVVTVEARIVVLGGVQ